MAKNELPASQLKPSKFGSRRLGVTDQRFYDMVRDGIISAPVIVKLGRTVMVNPEELEGWIAAGGTALPGGWRRKAS